MESQKQSIDADAAMQVLATVAAKKKKKSKKKPPSKEEIQAAVAAVVLAECEMWPEKLQALIGEDHPNKESFIKGVPYVIGAYMEIARQKLRAQIGQAVKQKGVETAKKMSPMVRRRKELIHQISESRQERLAACNRGEQREAREAARAIAAKWRAKRQEILDEVDPDEVQDLQLEIGVVEEEYEKFCNDLQVDEAVMMKMISAVDESKDDWADKARSERRKAHVEAGKKTEKTG